MDEDDDGKVVAFPANKQDYNDDAEIRAATGVERAGAIPKLTEESQPTPRPRWAAIWTFLAISILSLIVAALSPTGPEGTIKWRAALAFVIAILMGGGALIYRYSKEFWTTEP